MKEERDNEELDRAYRDFGAKGKKKKASRGRGGAWEPRGKKPFGRKPYGGKGRKSGFGRPWERREERGERAPGVKDVGEEREGRGEGREERPFGRWKKPFSGKKFSGRPWEERRDREEGEERPRRKGFAGWGEDREEGERPYGKKPHGRKLFAKKPFGAKPFGKKPFAKKSFGGKPFGKKPFGRAGADEGEGGFEAKPRGPRSGERRAKGFPPKKTGGGGKPRGKGPKGPWGGPRRGPKKGPKGGGGGGGGFQGRKPYGRG